MRPVGELSVLDGSEGPLTQSPDVATAVRFEDRDRTFGILILDFNRYDRTARVESFFETLDAAVRDDAPERAACMAFPSGMVEAEREELGTIDEVYGDDDLPSDIGRGIRQREI